MIATLSVKGTVNLSIYGITIAVTPQVLDLHLALALHEPKHHLFIYEHGTHVMH
jgi:hypothetical protein